MDATKLQHFLEDHVEHIFTDNNPTISIESIQIISNFLNGIAESEKAYKHIKTLHAKEKAQLKKRPLTQEEQIIREEVDKRDGGNYASLREYDVSIDEAIHHSKYYDYIPEYMREYIQQQTWTGKSYKFRIGARKIQVFIYALDGDKWFDKILHRVYTLIHFLQHQISGHNKECSQDLKIYLIMSDLKKTLEGCVQTNGVCVLGEQNANTAFTFSCREHNEIFLYRKEEWFKILTHELFHALGFDYSGIEDENLNKSINEIFPLHTDLKIYEAYCEFWADVLNSVFAGFYNNNKMSASNVMKKTMHLLQKERMFSIFQASKILTHYGIMYEDLFEQTDRARKIREMKYKETTSIFAYYIIKNILMFSIDPFILWCSQHNHSNIFILDPRKFEKGRSASLISNFEIDPSEDVTGQVPLQTFKGMKDAEDFVGFIREHYKDSRLLDAMRDMKEWFMKQKRAQRKDNMPLQTMRMTMIE
jgi:hypothetical protein